MIGNYIFLHFSAVCKQVWYSQWNWKGLRSICIAVS